MAGGPRADLGAVIEHHLDDPRRLSERRHWLGPVPTVTGYVPAEPEWKTSAFHVHRRTGIRLLPPHAVVRWQLVRAPPQRFMDRAQHAALLQHQVQRQRCIRGWAPE